MTIDMASKYHALHLPAHYGKWGPWDRTYDQLTLDDCIGLLVILVVTIAYLSHGYLWDKPDPYHHLWFEKPQARSVVNNLPAQTRNIATKLEERVCQPIPVDYMMSANISLRCRRRKWSSSGAPSLARRKVWLRDCREK